MLKAGFISLGCSKNLVDTEVMLGILAKNNVEITPEPAKADILIVNTCTFIQVLLLHLMQHTYQLYKDLMKELKKNSLSSDGSHQKITAI